jgi:hypothetical protein
MKLQNENDHYEESAAKQNQDILDFLQSHFIVDGVAVLSKAKRDLTEEDRPEIRVVSSLRHLAYSWKDLVEKKATLERTVTKLSSQPQPPPPFQSQPSPREDQEISGHLIPEYEGNSHSIGAAVPSISNSEVSNEPFLPSQIDSFGLETILEEDRPEEECRYGSSEFLSEEETSVGPGGLVISHTRRKRTPSPATTVFSSNNSTQTEPEEEVEEPTRDRDPGLLSASTLASQGQEIELGLLRTRLENWVEEEKKWVRKVSRGR